jgi:hypothetical protein
MLFSFGGALFGALSLFRVFESKQNRALTEAIRSSSFVVRCYFAPARPERILVVLGEGHFKCRAADELGKRVVDAFVLRGVEGVDCERLSAGVALKGLLRTVEVVVRGATFGLLKGSTIRAAWRAKTGVTFMLERLPDPPFCLHYLSIYLVTAFAVALGLLAMFIIDFTLPGLTLQLGAIRHALIWATMGFDVHLVLAPVAWGLRKHAWSCLIHPIVALVATRDQVMAKGTVAMLASHSGAASALVIMGRVHVPGYGRFLEELGFRSVDAASVLQLPEPGATRLVRSDT